MYLKQIEQLVSLQRIDNEIFDLQAEREAAPKEVTELEAQHAELVSRRDAMAEKLDYLRDQDQRLGSEIEDDNLKVKKSKNKLMMVGNTREYHAMMREMDNLEKLNRLREEEKVALIEELKRQEESRDELNGELNALEEQLKEKQSTLTKRMKEFEKRLSSLNNQRGDVGKIVPAPVLSRYEFIRSRLAHPVIVSVAKGICSGCHIAIPPQSFIELQKGEQILSCPNCQRLIYWCEHFCAPEERQKIEEQAAAAAAAEALESKETAAPAAEKKPKKKAPSKAVKAKATDM